VEVLTETGVGRDVKRLKKHTNDDVARLAGNLCAKMREIFDEDQRRQEGRVAGPSRAGGAGTSAGGAGSWAGHRLAPGEHAMHQLHHVDESTPTAPHCL
jgi:hypothetical protein